MIEKIDGHVAEALVGCLGMIELATARARDELRKDEPSLTVVRCYGQVMLGQVNVLRQMGLDIDSELTGEELEEVAAGGGATTQEETE